MKTLVTGATGFIGSYLIAALRDLGHQVIATDVVAEPEWISSLEGVSFVQADLCDEAEVDAIFVRERLDHVIHLAGLLAEACEANPSAGFSVNLMATLSLLDCCVRHGTSRFVMTSTPAVYGAGLPEPVADDAIKRPVTIYGQSKLACEHVLEWYARTHGVSAGAVRFPWVYGPGRVNGLTALYSSVLLDQIARGEEVQIENPEVIGDWLYVKDAVKALCLMLNSDTQTQITYNIMGEVHSVGEAMQIAQELFPEARITIQSADSAAYPYAASFDDTRARQELGWRPDYSLRQGMTDHVENIRKSMEAA